VVRLWQGGFRDFHFPCGGNWRPKTLDRLAPQKSIEILLEEYCH